MSSSSNKIVLKSSDGEIFEMEEYEARISATITNMIEVECAKPFIPILNVTGDILSKVIEYCQKHANTANDDDALRLFDNEFIDMDIAPLANLADAAEYLDIRSLQRLSCKTLNNKLNKLKKLKDREQNKIE
ncbi:hypothetical protein L2E82_28110 [Cichorium intybus]|uniref:Uncharacterized protein n=1 Tax=Cichorium intybus TaxID=13427 RepID=A0ACB9CUY0_CICIN|nr:hypothetical protein L2E82_28110 [Cichorium intybus]